MSNKKFSRFSSETPEVELPSHSDWFGYFGPKSCAMIAITLASQLPREFVYQQASLVYLPSKWQTYGTPLHIMRKILVKMNVKFVHHSDRLTCDWIEDRKYREFYGMKKPVYMTEAQFKRSNKCDKNKTYIVCNHEHAWVIKNGVTLDPVWFVENKQNSRRRIEDVIEIC
ncbi:hypothetical protein PP935_gp213 [Rhizobium phage RHph_N34]|uniref:Uncharacterized protein n=1 Tax=Rhizobium phage RHph_N34 TaxID=2509586 RepID=A0A7S5V020_9CAUD|nr:hypothetical protein PP935_gp213 [Rhizobium phage RHph_N34]QIG73988.1 hypothetical protein EVC06_213 [Rhizobium phage RHph_N34]